MGRQVYLAFLWTFISLPSNFSYLLHRCTQVSVPWQWRCLEDQCTEWQVDLHYSFLPVAYLHVPKIQCITGKIDDVKEKSLSYCQTEQTKPLNHALSYQYRERCLLLQLKRECMGVITASFYKSLMHIYLHLEYPSLNELVTFHISI